MATQGRVTNTNS